MYRIERDWVTQAGLRAIVILNEGYPPLMPDFRCGYVGLPIGNPLHGCCHNQRTEFLAEKAKQVAKGKCGKRSPISLVLAALNPKLLETPALAFDVHGGLTFSGSGIVEGPEWWFGFDCNHFNDGITGNVRSLEYVVGECEGLAVQILDTISLSDDVVESAQENEQ